MDDAEDTRIMEELRQMLTPQALRERMLKRHDLMVGVIAGRSAIELDLREGADDEIRRILGLRAPLPDLSADEVISWCASDPANEELYRAYVASREQNRP